MATKKELSSQQTEELIETLKTRFEENMHRHQNFDCDKIQSKLETAPDKLWSLNEMEITGGEPDIVKLGDNDSDYLFVDCSPESPKGSEVYATTEKHWNPVKNTLLKVL